MLRKILFGLFLFVVAIAAAITIFIMAFDLNDYRRMAEQKLSDMLGRPVEIASMTTKLAFVPKIKVEGLKIGNPEALQGEKSSFFEIKEMEAVVELMPLLKSKLNIHEVTVNSAELHLINKNGVNNWTFSPQKSKASEKASAKPASKAQEKKNFAVQLNTIDIDSLHIFYEDAKQQQEVKLQTLTLTDFHVISGEVVYGKHTAKIDLNTGRLEDLLAQKPDFPVDLKVQMNRANLRINGKIGDLKQLSKIKLTVTGNIPNVANYLRSLDIQSKYIPAKFLSLNASLDGTLNNFQIKRLEAFLGKKDQFYISSKGRIDNLTTNPFLSLDGDILLNDESLSTLWSVNKFTSNFKFTLNKQRFSLTKLYLESNRSDITINGSAVLQSKPIRIDATVTSEYFKVSDFIKQSSPQANNAKGAPVQTQPKASGPIELPWNLLNQVNGTVKLELKNIPLSDDIKQYAKLNTIMTVNQNQGKIPFEASILSGVVRGAVNLDGNKQSVDAQIQGRNLKLDDIRQVAKNIQGVLLDTDISLRSAGKTDKELLSHTNGYIVVELDGGYIVNERFVKLPQTLNLVQKPKNDITYSVSENRVPLLCGAANLTVKDGIAISRDQTALETDVLNFVVDGSVNLINQTLDVSMTPSLNKSNQNVNAVLAASQIVSISGPFNDLSFGVNPRKATESLVKSGLQLLVGDQQKADTYEAGALCSKALGGYKLAKTRAVKATPQKTATPQPQQQPAKQEAPKEFKDQLIDSLSKALQAGANKGAH